MVKHRAYISHDCPSCRRFVESVRACRSAAKAIQIVDVSALNSAELARLEVVPTVQTSTGQVLTGAKAFDFLKQYDTDRELEVYDVNAAGLIYSDFERDDGRLQRTTLWTPFEGVPE